MSSRAAAAVISSQRSAEVFAEVHKVQHLLTKDFERHDERQELFKRSFLKETRKHHQCICDAACAASNSMSAAGSSALLFAQHSAPSGADGSSNSDATDHDGEQDKAVDLGRQDGLDQTHIWNGLKSFYTPPGAATELICDACFSFRSATLAQELPPPWKEHIHANDPKKHYYYHPETKRVLWHPPPGTSALSRLVFERTNSVFAVCRCKPSHERRRRLMQRFRAHAQEMAVQEAEKRERQLRGAFSSLATSLMKKTTSQ
ncbi:hypothetical protein PybrP1_004340 [[Pythium] brassicae (nom. inval.)]|nr:hypothetical protein PybrP1_004340 [[Pythium] brassicae (nom. inval.)]